jgi:hypothetical protein
MSLIKIEEALNTWIVSDSMDSRLKKLQKLNHTRQKMIDDMIDSLYAIQTAANDNVIPLHAVNE